MVMAQPIQGDPGANGVVGSFYDFFAGLYSSSFTANQNWSGPFSGDGGSENQPPLKRNQTEHGSISKMEPQSPQPNAYRAVTAPSGFAGPRPHKPAPLEHGWPDDDPPPMRSRMPSTQDFGAGPPAGFPLPQSPLLESRQQQWDQQQQQLQLREQKKREQQEQRELVVREQEQQLLQQQQQVQHQQEQQQLQQQQQQQQAQQQRQDQAGKHGDGKYRGDKDDLLDQHVAYFIRKHPEVCEKHSIQRKSVGVYQLDGREVQIEWQYATEPGRQGFLVVVDGPLRQPFSDYMMDTDLNAQYEGQDIGKSNLHMISKERRLSFRDHHKVYSRLEAMKVAKEQALVREKAATYVKDGRDVPNELYTKYKKNLKIKLGLNRPKGQRPHPQLDSEIVMPVMPTSLSPQATAPAEQPQQPVQLLQQPQLTLSPQQPSQAQQGEQSPSGQILQPPPASTPSVPLPGSPFMPLSSRPPSIQTTPPSRLASTQQMPASAPAVTGLTAPCLPQPQLGTPQLLYSPGQLQGSPLGSATIGQPMPLQAPLGSAPIRQVPPMPGAAGLNWANAALQHPAGGYIM